MKVNSIKKKKKAETYILEGGFVFFFSFLLIETLFILTRQLISYSTLLIFINNKPQIESSSTNTQ